MNNSAGDKLDKQLLELHDKACENGEETYIDPTTGYLVFTKLFHLTKGQCCQNGCRHCPWRKFEHSEQN